MQGWRLYAGMIGLAALTGALVALLLSGGPRFSEARASARPLSTRSAAPTATPTPRVTPSPTERPSPSATSSPAPSPVDLDTLLRPAVARRILSGTTLLIAQSSGLDGTTLVAATPSGGPALPLASFGRDGGWQLRADGAVLAVSLETSADTARIATLNLRSGTVAWLTPDEPGIRQVTPIWSADGSLLYYASSRGPTDLGIWRIRADGTQPTRIRKPDGSYAGVSLQGLMPDGIGLVWSYVRAGGSAAVYELATGADRVFDDTTAATVVAWRVARPRALVTVGGGAGLPPGALVLWDDVSGTKKTLLSRDLAGSPDGVYGADFDPSGTRIVIAAYARIGGIEGSALNTIDLNGGNRTVIAGSEGAEQVLWFRAGIVFTRRAASGGTDVLLIPPSGGRPVTLFSDPGQVGKLAFVSP